LRKAVGIQSLVAYLQSVNYPLSEETVQKLIAAKRIPHQRLLGKTIIFNLDYIDSWIKTAENNQKE